MKPLLVNLTAEQTKFLDDIKLNHGISKAAYIRTILKREMESAPSQSFMSEGERVARHKHRIVSTRETDPRHIELMRELKSIFTARRRRADRHVMETHSARVESDSGEKGR